MIFLRRMLFIIFYAKLDFHRVFHTHQGNSLVDDHQTLWLSVHSVICVIG